MSNNNQDNSGIVVFAFVAAAAWIAFVLIYALAAFLTLALTIFCLCAWNQPKTIFGEITYPHEARAFVRHGYLGAVGLPLFAGFAAALLKIEIVDDAWPHFFFGGYILGSLGVEVLKVQEAEKARAMREINPEPETLSPPPRPKPQPRPASSRPFEYASWEDEEDRE
jgi:hypothetical protein